MSRLRGGVRRPPWWAVGLALSFAVALGCSWAVVVPVVSVLNAAAAAAELAVPVDQDVAVSAGDWAVYVTSGELADGSKDVYVADSAGVCGPVFEAYRSSSESVSWRGRRLTPVAGFHVERPGVCRVVSRSVFSGDDEGVRIVVAADVAARIERGWRGALAAAGADLLFCALAVGLVIRRLMGARGRYQAR